MASKQSALPKIALWKTELPRTELQKLAPQASVLRLLAFQKFALSRATQHTAQSRSPAARPAVRPSHLASA
jgi:hypothetical protein